VGRTFAVITCPANNLMAQIRDRMPVSSRRSPMTGGSPTIDPDPRGALIPFPSESMTMWPISSRVNKPEQDDVAIPEPAETTGEPSFL